MDRMRTWRTSSRARRVERGPKNDINEVGKNSMSQKGTVNGASVILGP